MTNSNRWRVCLEQYSAEEKDKKPRVLPYCGHTLCEGCLARLIARSPEAVTCPMCKKVNSLMFHKRVIDIPYSWPILDVLEQVRKGLSKAIEDEKARSLPKCVDCQQHEGSHWCRQHATMLCAYCAFRHLKECRSQQIVEQGELPNILKQAQTKAHEFLAQVNQKLAEAQKLKVAMTQELASNIEQLVLKLRQVQSTALSQLELYMMQLEMLANEVQGKLGLGHLNQQLPNEVAEMKTYIHQLNGLEELLAKHANGFEQSCSLSYKFDVSMYETLLKEINKLCTITVTSPFAGTTTADANASLFSACERGDAKIANFLLSNMSLDVNQRDQSGFTPFIVAVINKKAEVYRLLFERYKANVDIQDNAGKTALIYACLADEEEAAFYLVRTCKANLNLQNKWKDTALHCAVESGNLGLVKLLLAESTIDTNMKNGRGKTALDMAPNESIKQCLIAACSQPVKAP